MTSRGLDSLTPILIQLGFDAEEQLSVGQPVIHFNLFAVGKPLDEESRQRLPQRNPGRHRKAFREYVGHDRTVHAQQPVDRNG